MDEFSPPEEYYEPVKPSLKKNGKIEPYGVTDDKLKKPNGQIKWKDLPKVEPKTEHSDDDLSALLQVRLLTAKRTCFHTHQTWSKSIVP